TIFASATTGARCMVGLDHRGVGGGGRSWGCPLRTRGWPVERLSRARRPEEVMPGGASVLRGDGGAVFDAKVQTLMETLPVVLPTRDSDGKIDFTIVQQFCWSNV